MPEIKNSNKNGHSAFDTIICGLATAKEIIKELKDMLIETSHLKNKEEKEMKYKQMEDNTQELWDN